MHVLGHYAIITLQVGSTAGSVLSFEFICRHADTIITYLQYFVEVSQVKK